MKALVTGAAGFVGRHMIRELLSRGWEVDGVDPASDDAAVGLGAYEHHQIDALQVFSKRSGWARYDLVVHAAAAEPHRAAIDTKPMLLAANLHLDAAMFEWAVRTKQRRVLYLSSSAAYPVRLQTEEHRQFAGRIVPLTERTINLTQWGKTGDWSPDANYGWAKLTGERLAEAANEAGVPTHTVRPFSGYGEDQAECFPFRAFVERARRREDPFTIWGSAEQVRDFIHIDDVVAGALAVVDDDERRPVNLCTGVGTSMRDFALLCAHAAGYEPELKVDTAAPLGVAYRVGDPTRMNEHYTAKVSIEEGVRRALA